MQLYRTFEPGRHIIHRFFTDAASGHRLISGSGCRFMSDMCRRLVVHNVMPDDFLSLSFVYGDSSVRMKDRQFNFSRRRLEPLAAAKARIAANIHREIDKKLKRLSKKACAASGSQPSADQAEMPLSAESLSLALCLPGGEEVADETTCEDAFLSGNRLRVGEATYVVVVNPPTVKSIALPLYLMTGFAVRPKLEVEFAKSGDCEFEWYRSTGTLAEPATDAQDWEQVGSCEAFVATDSDLDRWLKVVCIPPATVWHPARDRCEAMSKVTVIAGPGRCPFEDRHSCTDTALPGADAFRCVSYNILADVYADSDYTREFLFPYCPPHALLADYRTQLLIKELKGYNSDVMCLQEVDAKLFEKHLSPILSVESGCNGPMTGTFSQKGGNVAEGVACFYRTTKFRSTGSRNILLSEEIVNNPLFAHYLNAIEKNENLKKTFLERTTTFQVVTLEFVEDPSRVLVVGNTHLYFRPDRDNIRLLQAGMCFTYLEQMVELERLARGSDAKVAPIFCGDFNSSPQFGVYQLATQQFVPEQYADWFSNEDEIVRDTSLHHSLTLASACGCPKYTNFTDGFADCIDYIFMDRSLLETSQVVPMPSESQLREHTALPSVCMPSDHLALVADIYWIKDTR